MKVITLTQPWATLVAIGAKKIESRSWSTSYRGPLAIHAAKGFGGAGGYSAYLAICEQEPFRSVLQAHFDEHYRMSSASGGMQPRGVIIAVCELVDVVRVETLLNLSDQERAFGNYSPGRYGWILANVWPLTVPIPMDGKLGLWECECGEIGV